MTEQVVETLSRDSGDVSAASEPVPYMEFDRLALAYGEAGSAPRVLEDISLSIAEGETVCLVGASGCGKSTLLNVAAGFLRPTAGAALIRGQAIPGPGADRVMVFQEDATFPWYTVRQNVAYGLRIQDRTKAEIRERTDEMLELVGLSGRADAFPNELSGGMKKRCDMARALAVEPESILMDEPFAALDVMTKERLQVQFRTINAERSVTSLFVTHDLEEAIFVGDRVAVLRRGPGPFLEVVDVPFGGDRDVRIKTSPEFQDIRRQLADLIAVDEAAGGHS